MSAARAPWAVGAGPGQRDGAAVLLVERLVHLPHSTHGAESAACRSGSGGGARSFSASCCARRVSTARNSSSRARSSAASPPGQTLIQFLELAGALGAVRAVELPVIGSKLRDFAGGGGQPSLRDVVASHPLPSPDRGIARPAPVRLAGSGSREAPPDADPRRARHDRSVAAPMHAATGSHGM